jgi:AraC-like DNA-binding protein
MPVKKPPPTARTAAFEKIPFQNEASIVWNHMTARRFLFVYHYHPEIELTYFAEGEGVEFVGDSSQTFKAGHLVLLGSNVPHFWVSDGDCQRAEACVIQFKPEIFGEQLLLLPELARLKALIEAAARGVTFSRLVVAQAVPLLMRLGEEAGAKRLLTLLEILALLSRDAHSRTLCTAAYQFQDFGEDKRRIETVYRYLSAHFREPCSVSEIAKAVGMHPDTFGRFFRRETGRTFVSTLIDLRLSYACKLLRETDKTISEVAYECGFGNLANFNRQFRWHYRKTPKEYRKHWAQEKVT